MSSQQKGLESCMSSQGWRGQELESGQGQQGHCLSRECWVFSHTCMGQASILKTKPRESGRAECRKVSCFIPQPHWLELSAQDVDAVIWGKYRNRTRCAHWAEGPGSCLLSISPVLRAPLVHGIARTEQTRLACGRHSASTVLSTSDGRLPFVSRSGSGKVQTGVLCGHCNWTVVLLHKQDAWSPTLGFINCLSCAEQS